MKHFYLKTKDFHSHSIMEGMQITHTQKTVRTYFKMKNLREYHDLYVQSDTLLLADVFENFINMCFKIYELDPAEFLPAPSMARSFKKDSNKIRSLSWYQYLVNSRKRY